MFYFPNLPPTTVTHRGEEYVKLFIIIIISIISHWMLFFVSLLINITERNVFWSVPVVRHQWRRCVRAMTV